MAFIVVPGPVKTVPYYKTQYVCTNPKCRMKTTASTPKRRMCPKCYAAMEVVDVSLQMPKEPTCPYCRRADCQAHWP